jgi:hypothetical protein
MTDKAITIKFVVPTALAIALGIMISMSTVHFADKSALPLYQADANHSAASTGGFPAQLSRVRLVLSNMK